LMSKRLKMMEDEVFVCCLDRGGAYVEDLEKNGVKTLVLNRRPGVFDFSILRELCALVRRERIEVLHSHNGCSVYGAIAGRIGRVKGIVHTDHGRLVPDKWSSMLEDRLASYIVDKYVAVSDRLHDYLLRTVRIPKRKLTTITNGVETARFRPFTKELITRMKLSLNLPKDCLIIGTVCRLDYVKNLPFMVETLKEVLKEEGRLKMLIVGDGPARNSLEETIRACGLIDRIYLLGERGDVEQLMPAFDIFVLPSLSEGTSMTLLEAMSCGVPVIASDVGGNSKIVREGENGFLFKLEEPEMLCNRVKQMLRIEKLREEMGKLGRQTAEREFSIDRMLGDYVGVYTSLMA
jgi:sugar transferase (PEP-CTERM/EpsH1 system associated)